MNTCAELALSNTRRSFPCSFLKKELGEVELKITKNTLCCDLQDRMGKAQFFQSGNLGVGPLSDRSQEHCLRECAL